MIEGLFKATYGTPLGQGVAVITLKDGTLQGGDPALYYTGVYKQDGDKFTTEFKTARHTANPQIVNVFGKDNVRVSVAGTIQGDNMKGTGTSPDAPGITFQVNLTKLKPL
jgi:hypothetical protein